MTFSIEDILIAIQQTPKHIIDVNTPPNIDGMLECEITTIEVNMFLFRLFGSDINKYKNYKNG